MENLQFNLDGIKNRPRVEQEVAHEYFPYVSGEMIEQNRKHMNSQLRKEIQDYFATKQGSWQRASVQITSPRLNEGKLTTGAVRTIFDSCYLRPEENPRVVNYTDPAKAYTIEQAKLRYEQKVEEDKQRRQRIEA